MCLHVFGCELTHHVLAGRGYECVGTREYLRAGGLIHSAYFDASLSSLQRLSNVWEAVFFFEGWREWIVGPHPLLPHGATPPTLNANFISSENYRDTLFAASSLTLTVFLHEVYFSGLPFDPSRLGSNGCEQYFGTLRTFVRNRNSFCLAEMLNTLTRVVGEIVAREEGAVAYPRQNARHTHRASRRTMQIELERVRKQAQGINQTPINSATTDADPLVVACRCN